MTGCAQSLRGGHHDLDKFLAFERDPERCAVSGVLAVHPLAPSAVHLTLLRDVGDVDEGRQDAALVGSGLGEVCIDRDERLLGLLVVRVDLVARDSDGETRLS